MDSSKKKNGKKRTTENTQLWITINCGNGRIETLIDSMQKKVIFFALFMNWKTQNRENEH